MAKVTLINPDTLAPPIGFAHAAQVDGWVWLAGQTASDESGTILYPGDMAGQFRQAIQNVASALRAAGCRPDGVVKLTYFVTDMAAYQTALKPIGAAYRAVFGRHYPAASLFEVKALFDPDALIEIECIAVQAEQAI